ncbi:MAG: anaerobic glycerol-3-phosphate dehydrogenase subunit C [Deltaproteobacteria bacterium]|nr:anaerobic glycerol-3-phosphate dehydrogenase subunit C [Deltaproteobacteria bacterium]
MLPIYLSEPSNEPARQRAAASLVRRALAPAPALSALRRDREHAAAHSDELQQRFVAALARSGLTVTRAATAAAAAERIAAVAAGSPIAATRAAVIGELQAALTQRRLSVVPTYGPGNDDFTGRYQRFWQLPPHRDTGGWASRAVAVGEAGRQRRAVVGLFGVNAASAATGALYLLQHSANIGELLGAARQLIFVVALDKLAADDAAALRQVNAAGTYGADSVLLDLARTRPLGNPLERFLPAGDAPAAIEVIVLDNGRRELLRGQYHELFICIGCRACATRCPTYPEFRGPRGWSPKDYLWSHLCGDNPSLELCTLCGNCEVDCPLDIPIPNLIAQRRAQALAQHGRGPAGWRRRLQGEVELLDKAFSATAPLSNYAPKLPLAATVMAQVFGLACERPLPAFRRDTFARWYARREHQSASAPQRRVPAPAPPAGQGEGTSSGVRPRLVYYFGCFANYNNPEVGQALVQLLEALGYEVVVPAWKCCGIPLYAKGEFEAAQRLVEFNVAALAQHVEAGDEIITSCPSCQLALARDYPRLFASPAADRVAAHTHFWSRFLLERGGLAGRLGGCSQSAAYHLPCHLRALGMENDTVELLRQLPGFAVRDIGRGCCGLSGTFGLERAHYRQSMEIGAGVFAAVKDSAFDTVLTDCGACKMQLEHGSGRAVAHPVEMLCRALAGAAASAPPEVKGAAA